MQNTKTTTHPFSRAGFTLIETMVTIVILGLFMVAALMGVKSLSDGSEVEVARAGLERDANKALSDIIEYIPAATLRGFPVAGDNDILFNVPVDIDGDGDALDGAMLVEWGVIRADLGDMPVLDPSLNGGGDQLSMGYRFVATDAWSEIVNGYDLNFDGDTADVFSIGRIERYYTGGTALDNTVYPNFAVIIAPNVVQVFGDNVGDIDGDGNDDPMFFQVGTQLQMNLFLMDDDLRDPFLINVNTSVELRNL